MTFREPLLALRHLVVLHKNTKVYDQTFHDGVNIIRGRNSTGKSTILDFVFFALGGDFVAWKPEAERCDNVLAEVEINQIPATLRRRVDKLRLQPMEIFMGTMEESLNQPFTGWQIFPFKRSESKESFSQLLFRMIGFPQVRSENDSNITMHQLLRLMCVDQVSNVWSLFRDEQFDSPLTRKTIGELLYGILDDRKYEDALRLRLVKREMESAQAEHTSLKAALSGARQMLDIETVNTAILEAQQQLDKSREAIKQASTIYEIADTPDQNVEFQKAEIALRDAKTRYATLAQQQASLELETEDSGEFIANLERRNAALNESVAAEQALGRLALQICPECLQPLDEHKDDGHCFLCKKPVGDTGREKRIAKLGYELVAQIQESKRILSEKEEELGKISDAFRAVSDEVAAAQRRFEDLSERLRSRRDAALDDMLIRRGALESQLKFLQNQLRLAEQLMDSERRMKKNRQEVLELEERIRTAQARQDARRIESEEAVNRIAVDFLHNDLPLEEEFKVAQKVEIDFERNICSVDGRPAFSASSVTFLKSAAHFAIFFASLELPYFRYPKFLTDDNIEDKGMEKERSQNLQRVIVKYSQAAKIRHQIIITTSMIADELNTDEFCIGPFYTPEHKTLAFPS